VIFFRYCETSFKGAYYAQSDPRGQKVIPATLQDDDLIRGNGSKEIIFRTPQKGSTIRPRPFPLFNGILIYDRVNFIATPDRGDVSTTVYFNDGTSLDRVFGILDQFSGYRGTNRIYLLDHNALSAVGKTLYDIVSVGSVVNIKHNLNFSDLGFGMEKDIPTPLPVEIEEPTDEPQFNLIMGSSGQDRLIGTSGSDIINGRGGSRDVLTGGEGQDFFIFGAEAGNYRHNRDVIRDFNVDEDTLVLEHGVKISRIRERNESIIIRLEGQDKDIIRLRNINTDFDSINIVFQEGAFEAP
jgi:Ca2+-binding RTX toxin-like protein